MLQIGKNVIDYCRKKLLIGKKLIRLKLNLSLLNQLKVKMYKIINLNVIGLKAVQEILDKKGIDPMEIELLICATTTPDFTFPATANVITDKLGMKNAWGYDVSAACSGFIYALTTASQFIESGKHKKVIVVGGDKMSSILNF